MYVHALGEPHKFLVCLNVVFGPNDIEAPDLTKCYMPVLLRASPITLIAHLHIVLSYPIRTMLTRPRLGAVAGTTKQHKRCVILRVLLATYLVWNAVIHLEMARFIVI
jgi:hypothetical protein